MTLGGSSYFFEHLLTREAAYSALLEHNRRALHSLAADLLGGRIVPGSQSEWELLPQLAGHLSAAGRSTEARDALCAQLVLMAESGRYERWDGICAELSALSRVAAAGDEGSALALLEARGLRDYSEGRFARAQEQLEQALAAQRAAGDEGAEGRLLQSLGAACQRLGRIEQARDYFEAALALQQRRGNIEQQCQAQRRLAILHRDASRRSEAERCSREALRLAQLCGSLRLECQTRVALGNEAKMYRSWLEAAEHQRLGLELAEQLGDLESQSACLAGHAEVLAVRGKTVPALAEAQRALDLARVTGNARSQSFALNIIGCAHSLVDEPQQAGAALQLSLSLSAQAQYPWGRMLALHYLARLQRSQGGLEAAQASFREAAALAQQLGHPAVAAVMEACSFEADLEAGRLEEAAARLPALADVAQQLAALWSCLPACLCARLRLAQGRAQEAQDWLARASLASAEFQSAPASIPWRHIEQTRALLGQAAPDAADPAPADC
ncbi:tetratricopeptide repeat protein [bacterium]|nr:tetratricopeptide repeat protein [bacterium]